MNYGVTVRQYNDTRIERKTMSVKDKIGVTNMFNGSGELGNKERVNYDVVLCGYDSMILCLKGRINGCALVSYS